MLGLNHSVRKTPVSSRTTKLHSAISPSMKDQWSGKTLRTCFLVAAAMPVRSSAQFAAAPILLGLAGLAAFRLAAGPVRPPQDRREHRVHRDEVRLPDRRRGEPPVL